MSKKATKHLPFEIRDCALAAIATGEKAQNLKELKDIIVDITPGCIYYHFWGQLLRPRFDDPEYHNDFASWARHALHDKILAEKLAVLDPTELPDIEMLRAELIDIIEERLDENEHVPWCKQDQQFHFVTSQIVIFNTRRVIKKAEEMVSIIPSLTSSSIFYHFIEARRRTFGNIDDFSSWLYGFDGRYRDLCDMFANVDPFFSTLPELKKQIASLVNNYFMEKK
ncbi:MAG: hypothetical protein JW814_09370 [Candidatus Krumholzibacteriota bacterium]|nr:hypothetical protein [Candidatus Krumholzibacteriota bacterium]